MKGLSRISFPSCRGFIAPSSRVTKRYKFSARPRPDSEATQEKPLSPARTRFAPSPTGFLHIGSLRTALYNYLLAKATKGSFILRLEDTDQSRLVPGAEQRLYEDLKWAGLDWDEGPDIGAPYGPYVQSQRLEIYKEHADKLINEGRAYRCFCTPEELDRMKSMNMGRGGTGSMSSHYSGKCSHIDPATAERRAANGEPHCVRFRSRDDVRLGHHDIVYGNFTLPTKEDDFIIIKRDGFPTYHFANVVDDHLMEITHVIRGAEWLLSTPKHVSLYNAFGWKLPAFAHVGLLVDETNAKLSKRHRHADISSWRDQGILPIALLNYVALLGWSPMSNESPSQTWKGRKGEKKMSSVEVMDMDTMISKFHLKFTKGDITINNKHAYLQKVHMRQLLDRVGPEGFATKFLEPVTAAIEECEAARVARLARVEQNGQADQNDHNSQSTDRTGAPVSASSPYQAMLPNLGPLVPLASSSSPSSSQQHHHPSSRLSQPYIRQILRQDAEAWRSPAVQVSRSRYLLWQIPRSQYEASLRAELFPQNRNSNDEGQGKPQFFERLPIPIPIRVDTMSPPPPPPPPSSLAADHPPLYNPKQDEPRRVSELVARLREILVRIPETDWVRARFEEGGVLGPWMKGVYISMSSDSKPEGEGEGDKDTTTTPTTTPTTHTPPSSAPPTNIAEEGEGERNEKGEEEVKKKKKKEEKEKIWGFHLVRWVLAAGEPGPALMPSLEILGREETLRRVDMAYEVAVEVEGDGGKERGGGR
ncbi:hypothetical protein F4778DRAFT_95847 [Xylariomycetidae sp. FL2044]|nr:hypothetical protein F4778DRAFT_95847 [Xylariomycetidae sp. FL2044]